MQRKPRAFESLLNEVLPAAQEKPQDEDTKLAEEDFPVADSLDVRILMHRDIHFGGNFNLMLEHYHNDGIGVDEELTVDRIFNLAHMERDAKQNLAPVLLSGPDMEEVARAKKTYEKLRDLLESDSDESHIPRLIAELILSEEEEPVEEMEAIVQEGEPIVPTLIDLMLSDEFSSKLFPGYGRAPTFATQCLGRIGSAEAIPHLFQVLSHADFDLVEDALAALYHTGDAARDFLLQLIRSETLTSDHQKAAFALAHFSEQEEVAKACFAELKKPHIRTITDLASYLALCCEGLQSEEDREQFRRLRKDPSVTKALGEEMDAVIAAWH